MSKLPPWAETIAVFDTETTGVDLETARIVTATVAVLDSAGDVQERHDWIIDPGIEIPEPAAAVHGVTTEMARASGVDPKVGIQQIVSTLNSLVGRGLAVVAYNAPYDFTILDREVKRNGLDQCFDPTAILDPLVIDKQVDRYRKGKRTLTATIEQYGVSIGKAHDAGEDAIAAGRLMQQIARKYAGDLPDSLDALHAAQIDWARAQTESFVSWMRANRDPNFAASGEWPTRS